MRPIVGRQSPPPPAAGPGGSSLFQRAAWWQASRRHGTGGDARPAHAARHPAAAQHPHLQRTHAAALAPPQDVHQATYSFEGDSETVLRALLSALSHMPRGTSLQQYAAATHAAVRLLDWSATSEVLGQVPVHMAPPPMQQQHASPHMVPMQQQQHASPLPPSCPPPGPAAPSDPRQVVMPAHLRGGALGVDDYAMGTNIASMQAELRALGLGDSGPAYDLAVKVALQLAHIAATGQPTSQLNLWPTALTVEAAAARLVAYCMRPNGAFARFDLHLAMLDDIAQALTACDGVPRFRSLMDAAVHAADGPWCLPAGDPPPAALQPAQMEQQMQQLQQQQQQQQQRGPGRGRSLSRGSTAGRSRSRSGTAPGRAPPGGPGTSRAAPVEPSPPSRGATPLDIAVPLGAPADVGDPAQRCCNSECNTRTPNSRTKGKMVQCEGFCRRAFHVECSGARNPVPPRADTPWFCGGDCANWHARATAEQRAAFDRMMERRRDDDARHQRDVGDLVRQVVRPPACGGPSTAGAPPPAVHGPDLPPAPAPAQALAPVTPAAATSALTAPLPDDPPHPPLLLTPPAMSRGRCRTDGLRADIPHERSPQPHPRQRRAPAHVPICGPHGDAQRAVRPPPGGDRDAGRRAQRRRGGDLRAAGAPPTGGWHPTWPPRI